MLNNIRGFSLVETLVAIAISTATALVVYKVIGESQKGQVVVENRDEINQLHREIVGKFTDRSICTPTISGTFTQPNGLSIISQILNLKGQSLLSIPFKRGKVSLAQLEISKLEKDKNQAEILATYSSLVPGKVRELKKTFTIELSFKENLFEGCMTRGTLGIDPKDACDLVVGVSGTGESYFYNGKCNFAKASCEQSGRIWNEQKLNCELSAEDLLAVRRDTCALFNMKFAETEKKCLANEVMIKAFEDVKKLMEVKSR